MSGSLTRKRNPVAVALMGALVLVFLILGVGSGSRLSDIFAGTHADAVVVAGDHLVTAAEYKNELDQRRQALEKQTQQSISYEFIVEHGMDAPFLSEMAQTKAQSELLRRAGVVPADALVDEQIRKEPVFFDRVTGKFSPQQFLEALNRAHLTPRQAQAQLKDAIADRHFMEALATAPMTPRLYSAITALGGLSNHDLTYFAVPQTLVAAPKPPTDEQLAAFIKAHPDRFTIPETRVITLVRISAKALAATLALAPGAVEREFTARKDSLSKPETRSLVIIAVKTAAQAAEAAARLTRGDDPAAVAKAYGVAPIVYADKAQAALADRKLAAAAFALKAGQAQGPVQGNLGLAAIKVTDVKPGTTATLESARAQIESDLKAKAAAERVADQEQKFDEARQAGATIPDAAAKAGLTPATIGPFTASGQVLKGPRPPELTDAVLKTAFEESAGADTDLQDDGPGEEFALKVESVLKPQLVSIADHRPELTAAYMRDAIVGALKAKVAALVERLKKGESPDVLAASVGAHVAHQVGMQAAQAEQYARAMGPQLVGQIFSAKAGDVFTFQDVVIMKIDAIRPPDMPTLVRYTQGLRGRDSSQYVDGLTRAIRQASVRAVNAKTNLALARKALNVEPSTPTPGKPAGKPASSGLAQ